MSQITVERLKAIETIQHVPDEQLQWLIDQGEVVTYEPGDEVFKSGAPMDRTFVIFEGKFRICQMQAGKVREVAELEAGAITGYLPFSRGKVTVGWGECLKTMLVLEIPAEKIREGIKQHYELTEALVHIMTTRVRDYTAMQQQNEKMVALGKLSAGLAHELNNPAAAIVRNTAALKEQIKHFPSIFKQVAAIKLDVDEVEPVNDLIKQIATRPEKLALNMLQRSEMEDEVIDWLEDNHIKDYEMAETLVDNGLTTTDLDKLNDSLALECVAPVLSWVTNNLTTDKLVTDIQEAARRISDLVGSVKNFTYMDRATDRQLINIHVGIRNTLKMLGYKLKKGNIQLKENFDDSLPEIYAFPGELNQVWTNLIDNAIDAMESKGAGVLTITTRRDNDFLQVLIIDNGSGIPDEIRSSIFDPFFTTKEMGKGTGMGLDVVNRIVKQHNGTVKVRSKPGETEFEVCLPMRTTK